MVETEFSLLAFVGVFVLCWTVILLVVLIGVSYRRVPTESSFTEQYATNDNIVPQFDLTLDSLSDMNLFPTAIKKVQPTKVICKNDNGDILYVSKARK